MDSSDRNGNEPKLLTEERLKHMSRHIKSLVPQQNGSEVTEDKINELSTTLEDIFCAASRPNLTASHRVAAWNTLCALIDQCAASKSQALRECIWDQDVWDRSFNLYLDQSPNTRPKSSKQLLSTLSSILRRTDSTTNIRLRIGQILTTGILNDGNPRRAKACLQALAHLLAREVLALDDIFAYLHDSSHATKSTRIQLSLKQLLSTLFKWAAQGDLGSVAGQVVSVVLDKTPADLDDRSILLWAEPLESVIRCNDVKVDDLRSHILPVLFKRSVSDYTNFLKAHGVQSFAAVSPVANYDTKDSHDAEHELLYAALQTGKGLGLLYETDKSELSTTATSIFFPLRAIDRLLCKSSRTARLTGLSLLITSHSMTRPFPKETFRILKRRLHLFFADTDANFRGDIFSIMQKLMDRMRAISAVLARQASDVHSAASTLQDHRALLEWLLRFLSWELRPTSSYQRHISALKTLSIVVKSALDDTVPTEYLSKSALAETKWSFHLSIMNSGLCRMLLDLLVDPFDDVRQTSASILSMYAATYDEGKRQAVTKELTRAIHRAETSMLATGRADQADGVAHLYSLLFQHCDDTPVVSGPSRSPRQQVLVHLIESLEQMLDVAKKSLVTAATKYPIHGLLTSLRYIIMQKNCACDFEQVSSRVVHCLNQVWRTVKPVLCDDAPEGFVVEETEESPDTSTKDLLSYCWRALKESSLLLGSIISQKPLTPDKVVDLSNLCFTQLVELRHRGAFSAVAQTWVTCCIRCTEMKSADGQMRLDAWYERALGVLNEKTTINTRRSAGLPSLICGLLVADNSGLSLSRTINDLMEIARQPVDSATLQESSLPQVHALNSIKDILKNSRLAELSETHVSEALLLAGDSLRSEAWAIRNCGLMLFRAVIDRLLGTSEAHMDEKTSLTRRISVQQHPRIFDAVLGLLKSSQTATTDFASGSSEGVFPALQLLQRMQIPESKLYEAQAAVFALTASASWHIRDKAARVYAVMFSIGSGNSEIERLLLARPTRHNALHGALLCVKYLIATLRDSRLSNTAKHEKASRLNGAEPGNNNPETWRSTVSSASDIYHGNGCPVIKATVIDILVEGLQQYTWSDDHARSDIKEPYEKEANTTFCGLNIFSELDLLLDSQYRGASEAILRRSLVRAFCYELFVHGERTSSDVENTVSTVLKIARSNANACSLLIADIRRFRLFSTCRASSACTALLQACSDILGGCCDLKAKCEVQRFLLYLAEEDLLPKDRTDLSQALVNACRSASTPLGPDTNQLYADQWLQLQAVSLDYRLHTEKAPSQDIHSEIANLVFCCSVAIQPGDYGVHTREAATLTLSRVRRSWDHLAADNSPHFYMLCIAVYDLLNDDDEDTRLLASKITRCIIASGSKLSYGGHTLEPVTASQYLLRFMIRRWSREAYFATAVFARAFDTSASVADQLGTFTTIDTALFAEEKQNLYVDEAIETKVWSQVALALHAPSIPRQLVDNLTWWVLEGLNALVTLINSDVHGPLGWSSKPGVFQLGLQVMHGTEVLLHLVESGVKLPVRPSLLRQKLGILRVAGRAQDVNLLWLYEMDRVLDNAVARQLVKCRRLLDTIASKDSRG